MLFLVNCGMLLIMAAIRGEHWNDFSFENEPIDYTSNNFSQMGVLSLMLTIANVIMVALGATLMFRAKEVLPVKKKIFWDDLKIARRIYQVRIFFVQHVFFSSVLKISASNC